MIGILVVTHGNLGKELLKSAELIVGTQNNTLALGLFHGDSIDQFREKVIDAVESLDDGDGVLIFADLYGGSPSNIIALSMKEICERHITECITGVNLPMVL